MAFKLAISAGHYYYTSGKRCSKSLDPKQTREWTLNDRIADKIEKLLKDYNGIEVKRLDDTTGQKAIDLAARSKASNKWGADFYLSIHHNAGIGGGSGGGIVAFIYNGKVDATTVAWQKELYNELIKLTGLKGNRATPLAKADLHECRETIAPAVLLELGFMDSKTDVPIILTEDYANKCAQACVNVIVKRAKLTKKTSAPATPVKTYKLLTKVNKYSSADDAKAKKNSKGTFSAGTYYIYTKYPNGVNGMYNLTTDKTGSKPGSWINPAENVLPEKKEEPIKEIYYITETNGTRIDECDTLEEAKEFCITLGRESVVVDKSGKKVYTYTPPKKEEVKPEPEVTPTPEEEKKEEILPTPEPEEEKKEKVEPKKEEVKPEPEPEEEDKFDEDEKSFITTVISIFEKIFKTIMKLFK